MSSCVTDYSGEGGLYVLYASLDVRVSVYERVRLCAVCFRG